MMKLLTIQELAELLNAKVTTIYSWVNRGNVPYLKFNGLVRFDQTEIQAWIEESRRPHNVTTKQPRKPTYDKDIDSTIRKAIDVTLCKGYTQRNEKTDRGQGSKMEVINGTI
jgi:excisionase family DNA binding protein